MLQSIPLWLDYLNFVQENSPSVRECSPDGLSKARLLFESALTACGLHIAEGNKMWEAYREFEQAIYYTIDDTDPDVRTYPSYEDDLVIFSFHCSLLASF